MKPDIFSQIGLNEQQVLAYKHLLQHGATTPPRLAKSIKLTRSNAYKVLDQLVERGLVGRSEADKKLLYRAEDPIVLASLVAEERNRVIALEKDFKAVVNDLRKKYQKTVTDNTALTYKGAPAIMALYRHQAELEQPIYLIKGRTDRLAMGFESIQNIRFMANKLGTARYGMTADVPEEPANPSLDQRSNLNRTWFDEADYKSTVEWTVSGDELMIIDFSDTPNGIRIKNQAIADAFTQLWKMLDKSLKADPNYKKLPRKAKRTV